MDWVYIIRSAMLFLYFLWSYWLMQRAVKEKNMYKLVAQGFLLLFMVLIYTL